MRINHTEELLGRYDLDRERPARRVRHTHRAKNEQGTKGSQEHKAGRLVAIQTFR